MELETMTRSTCRRIACALAAVALVAAAAGANAKTSSQRIASIGGDATEILYALGLEEQVVAVDSTSLYPETALKQKANVGYLRQLTTEGVLSTGASVIFANAQAGPPDVVRALKASRIRYETLPGNESPDNIADKIRFAGRLFGKEQEAQLLAADVTRRFAALTEKRAAIGKPVRAMFVLGITSGRAMIAGSQTTADTVLRLAGAENAASSLTGYKPLTDEALLDLSPDVVVTIRRGTEMDTAELIATLPGYRQTPAGKAGRIVEMDAHYLLGFGPRTPQAAGELMARLYPQAR